MTGIPGSCAQHFISNNNVTLKEDEKVKGKAIVLEAPWIGIGLVLEIHQRQASQQADGLSVNLCITWYHAMLSICGFLRNYLL